jgi:hypothetical protein
VVLGTEFLRPEYCLEVVAIEALTTEPQMGLAMPIKKLVT